MLKRDEMMDKTSCLNKARSDERIFVLLARDAAAPAAIRAWAHERIRIGKNAAGDRQIIEAFDCADRMEDEASRIDYRTHGGGMAGHDERAPSDPVLRVWLAEEHGGLHVARKEIERIASHLFAWLEATKP